MYSKPADNHDILTHTILEKHHRHFDCIESTNTALMQDILSAVLADDMPMLYTADSQTLGKGQHGRSWISPSGNVYLSLYIPIKNPSNSSKSLIELKNLNGLFSLVVGYMLAKIPTIEKINLNRKSELKPLIGVKWANDIGFYDDRALFNKLAGILIEPVYKKNDKQSIIKGAIIGIGINVEFAPEISDGLYQSTSINQLANFKYDYKELYPEVVASIINAINLYNLFDEKIVLFDFIENYNKINYLHNKEIAIFEQNNQQDINEIGFCLGLDNHGGLIIKGNDGSLKHIYAGTARLVNK